MDRWGRRVLVLSSTAVSTICMLVLGIHAFYIGRFDGMGFDTIPLISICVFIAFYAIGLGPIPFLMMSELFPNHIKGFAISTAGALNWTAAFTITATFVPLTQAIGDGATYWMFAGIGAIGTVFIYFVVPETKGRTLYEIQILLEGK